eukprot:Lankesteria_metandrocarpae@DN5441_c0_g2_i1.p1
MSDPKKDNKKHDPPVCTPVHKVACPQSHAKVGPVRERFEHRGWSFEVCRSCIWSATLLSRLEKELQLICDDNTNDKVKSDHTTGTTVTVPANDATTNTGTGTEKCEEKHGARTGNNLGTKKLQLIPEVYFGSNWVRLSAPKPSSTPRNDVVQNCTTEHTGGTKVVTDGSNDGDSLTLSFTPRECLAASMLQDKSSFTPPSTGFVPQPPTAAAASEWKKKVNELPSDLPFQLVSTEQDWTFSSKYWGAVQRLPAHNSRGRVSTSTARSNDITAHCEYNTTTTSATGSTDAPNYQQVTTTGGQQHNSNSDNLYLQDLLNDTNHIPAECGELVGDTGLLPLKVLMDTTIPILWFQQVDLYGDDLSDGGICHVDVKLRVMPNFFYVLLRQDIRVDNVILRQVETRYFHEFGSNELLRTFLWKEALYSELAERGICLEGGGKVVNSEQIGTHILADQDVKWRIGSRIQL